MLDNVYSFEYLGSRLQCDGDDEADVRYRMDIAQAAFASLSHLWMDHRLSRNMKLRLYNLCVCSTLTHSCEAWNLTKAVSRILNGFNSRCLHVITGEEYRDTAISPAYNLLLAVRQRRLRYLGHFLRLPRDSVVRRTLIAMTDGDNPNRYPEGSIFMDCQGSELKDLETLASEPHCMAAQSGGTCVLRLHYIIGPTGSIMNMMMMIIMPFSQIVLIKC